MGRGWAGAALAVALVCVLAGVLLGPGAGPRTLDQRVQDVTEGLRCPSCDGESVAQSNAPLARSMRSEVRAQVAQGRSTEQVEQWFRQRYGDAVVQTPQGSARALWVVPPLALVLGALVVLRLRRRDGTAAERAERRAVTSLGVVPLAGAAGVLVGLGLLVPWLVTVSMDGRTGGALAATSADTEQTGQTDRTERAGDPVARAQRLDDAGRHAEAVTAWREALQADGSSAVVRTRLGLDLLRAGHPDQVAAVVGRLAERAGPQQPTALLVLGLARRQLGRPDAAETLRRFLALAPQHPAAAQVRRLLEAA